MNYANLATHRLMVRDETRTAAFQKAIAATVKPGDVVVDVGAGCGILSLFAAQAGAARVYAVERDPGVAGFAQRLAAENGFSQIVRVIPADIRLAGIAEKASVIVSEWMGTIGVEENMYGAVLWARDNLLAPGGRMIPQSVTAMAAPAAPAQRADLRFFADGCYGLDLKALSEPSVVELLLTRRRVLPEDLAAPPQALWTSNAATDPPDMVRNPLHAELTFKAGRQTKANSIALWFEADLGGGVTLRNAPDAPDTHWGQMLLPLDRTFPFGRGDRLKVGITVWPVGPGPLMFAWRWQINDAPALQLDTVGGAGVPTSPSPSLAEIPTERSELSRFLARLAVDPERLQAFLADPDKAMAELPPAYADALKSGDPYQIGTALYGRKAEA